MFKHVLKLVIYVKHQLFIISVKTVRLFFLINHSKRKSGAFHILGLFTPKNQKSHGSLTVLNCIYTEM